jgi:hypothetical protein
MAGDADEMTEQRAADPAAARIPRPRAAQAVLRPRVVNRDLALRHRNTATCRVSAPAAHIRQPLVSSGGAGAPPGPI